MANIQTERQADGSYNVTVTIGLYSTTLQHNATEAEAMQKATELMPMLESEAAEYAAMQF